MRDAFQDWTAWSARVYGRADAVLVLASDVNLYEGNCRRWACLPVTKPRGCANTFLPFT